MVGRCGVDSVIIAVTMRRIGREGDREKQKSLMKGRLGARGQYESAYTVTSMGKERDLQRG
jgi:hypothetical protein